MRITSAILNLYWFHAIALRKLSNECSYKFSWILILTEVIGIWILRIVIIYTIMNFYWSMLLPFKNCPISSYKFSWILTLTEIRTIRILRLSVISAIMNFYGSHVIALQKLSNERSYKLSWILTLTEVISIWILRMLIIYTIINFYWSILLPFKNCPMNVLINLVEF